ncbi:hypothetical protein L249_5385 [Ophiocordyceps polyrhachis-furcata BCC 54312]|uniref:Uncharacterized protein n=1 Tax=Ophiocordyceps polyrhachis-furcata BCC 54312 TaxID=1330021 RepID=A0A367L8D4_9HYPO|nr:hypothetical protein L249_5385 [Ophiocordyceps polyrhachis-furcata BCC 54312]
MSHTENTLFRLSDHEGSEVDSDLEELRDDIAKLDESVRNFLASHHGLEATSGSARGGSRARGTRGPRKAAKPRGDITARLSKVNQAFLNGDYDQALDLATEVIRINAETHQAWTTLASIFRERGEPSRALSAMVYAAHLRPKDISGWLECASFALDFDESRDQAVDSLDTARLCYSAALRIDPAHIDARLGKAAVCHRQGHYAAAITEYKSILKRQPHDLEVVRKLAEACLDSRNTSAAVPSAVEAYKQFFALVTRRWPPLQEDSLWHDIGIFVDLLASINQYEEAIYELKSRSRWLVGRSSDLFWDEWKDDDREWDLDELRRMPVNSYSSLYAKSSLHGNALPQDLRIRLATYRLKLGHVSEALKHLHLMGWDDTRRNEFVEEFPFLAYDLAFELHRHGQQPLAIQFLQLLRNFLGDSDPSLLLHLGRSYLASGEQSSAEECLLAAIEADQDSIDARIELANIYEKAREDEEALILAAEAMALQEARAHVTHSFISGSDDATRPGVGLSRRRQCRVLSNNAVSAARASYESVVPRRYRPKRLTDTNKRLQDEQARVAKLSKHYETVRDLKQQIVAGREDLIPAWMATSKELVDDFRSLRRFYSWDKYLHFLGSGRYASTCAGEGSPSELTEMYERLSRCVAPQSDQPGRGLGYAGLSAHRGISFDDWLDLFLDYAIGLALMHRQEEAYQICKAAKDSTVFQSPEYCFNIDVAWSGKFREHTNALCRGLIISVCAIYTNDEERCVTIARQLMRDGATTDSYRMFALLSRLTQSPIAWYTSGPAQKFVLRQIKAIDASHSHRRRHLPESNIDTCLLMLYVFIYASIDSSNPMINISLGLAYVHYGMKRQSANPWRTDLHSGTIVQSRTVISPAWDQRYQFEILREGIRDRPGGGD